MRGRMVRILGIAALILGVGVTMGMAQDGKVYHACVNNSSGTIKMMSLDDGDTCNSNEVLVSWNGVDGQFGLASSLVSITPPYEDCVVDDQDMNCHPVATVTVALVEKSTLILEVTEIIETDPISSLAKGIGESIRIEMTKQSTGGEEWGSNPWGSAVDITISVGMNVHSFRVTDIEPIYATYEDSTYTGSFNIKVKLINESMVTLTMDPASVKVITRESQGIIVERGFAPDVPDELRVLVRNIGQIEADYTVEIHDPDDGVALPMAQAQTMTLQPYVDHTFVFDVPMEPDISEGEYFFWVTLKSPTARVYDEKRAKRDYIPPQ